MDRLGLLLALVAACSSNAKTPATPPPTTTSSPSQTIGYDAALARRLNADEYGMHPYVMALLKPGPKRDQTPDEAKRLMKAHLENINRLAEQGSLVLAGPFSDEGPFAGIYVFKVKTIDEARALTATDPAIQAGRLEMELHPWYGSAALQEVNAIHKRLEKSSVTDAVK